MWSSVRVWHIESEELDLLQVRLQELSCEGIVFG